MGAENHCKYQLHPTPPLTHPYRSSWCLTILLISASMEACKVPALQVQHLHEKEWKQDLIPSVPFAVIYLLQQHKSSLHHCIITNKAATVEWTWGSI